MLDLTTLLLLMLFFVDVFYGVCAYKLVARIIIIIIILLLLLIIILSLFFIGLGSLGVGFGVACL